MSISFNINEDNLFRNDDDRNYSISFLLLAAFHSQLQG
jgi:hypothetical protein